MQFSHISGESHDNVTLTPTFPARDGGARFKCL